MSPVLISALSVALGVVLILVALRWRSHRVNVEKFTREWKELQGYCKTKDTWPQALQQADKLLDAALRKRNFKGKSMGERMVSAQRAITNNDAMWFAHNLVRKMTEKPEMRLKEQDVKSALVGFRSALKDLDALMSAKPQTTTDQGESES